MGQRKAGRPPAPRHAAGPRRRAARPAPKRRSKPRYGRAAVAGSATGITLIALLGGMGILPSDQPAARATAVSAELSQQSAAARSVPAQLDPTTAVVAQARAHQEQLRTERQQASDQSALAAQELSEARAARVARKQAESGDSAAAQTADGEVSLPSRSGTGRRAVFDMSSQRVWIVGNKGRVERTYLVSGSVLDNLDPGTYEVFSRSRHAVGVDDSGEMEYFVRFTRGKNAAIGFHSIPTQDGKPLQTRDQLGTPQSHGCIRQARPDAIAMWAFAHVGTKVVVTA